MEKEKKTRQLVFKEKRNKFVKMDLKLQMPTLEVNNSSDWGLWKQKFELYLKATGKSYQTKDIKIALLLTSLGDQAIEINNTFKDDQKDNLQKLLKNLMIILQQEE